MILVDTHVHIHDCFIPEFFFDSAWENFQIVFKSLCQGGESRNILMLTEASEANWFDRLRQAAGQKSKTFGKWMVRTTGEESSLCLHCRVNKSLYVLAGRQIQSSEGLEVLALGTKNNYGDGSSVAQLIGKVEEADGVPVVPWGFGKWIGRRGKIINRLLENSFSNFFCMGDNGGRYKYLKEPSQFNMARKLGVKILPGSDPLPFAHEFRRVGSYGFYFEGAISETYPALDIKQKLRDPSFKYHSYGNLETFINFARNQFMIQFKNRFGKKFGRYK